MLPPGNSRVAYETLCPSRAENSALVAFSTLKSETVLLGENMTEAGEGEQVAFTYGVGREYEVSENVWVTGS